MKGTKKVPSRAAGGERERETASEVRYGEGQRLFSCVIAPQSEPEQVWVESGLPYAVIAHTA